MGRSQKGKRRFSRRVKKMFTKKKGRVTAAVEEMDGKGKEAPKPNSCLSKKGKGESEFAGGREDWNWGIKTIHITVKKTYSRGPT